MYALRTNHYYSRKRKLCYPSPLTSIEHWPIGPLAEDEGTTESSRVLIVAAFTCKIIYPFQAIEFFQNFRPPGWNIYIHICQVSNQ